LPQAGEERARLVAFVEVAEQAKAAFNRGALLEAHRLYGVAMQRGTALGQFKDVQEVLAKCRLRFLETAAVGAASAGAVPSAGAAPSTGVGGGAAAVAGAAAQPADELQAAIQDLILPAGASGVRWEDVIGLEDAKRALWEAVVLPALNPALFTGLRAPPRGILMYGPPGNGKTFLARAAASQCRATFFAVSASSLTSKWHGESEKMVRALFQVARDRAPSVVFLDEVDSVLSARSSSESEAGRRLKTEFLVQMEGVTDGAAAGRVVLLGATNRPFDLDEAVLRRFAIQVNVPLPEVAARAQLLRSALTEHRHSLSMEDLVDVARRTERFSSSDAKNLCKEASMAAVREVPPDQVANLRVDQLRPITLQDFYQAMQAVQPSVSSTAVEQLNAWSQRQKR